VTTTTISASNFDFQNVYSGNTLVIEGTAFTSQDDVRNGGVLIIISGQLAGPTDEFTTIESGGTEYLSGASAYDDGAFGLMEGTQVVLSGGEASATEVGSRGQIVVSSASEVVAALVSGGGTITVLDDGESISDSLMLGAVEIVSNGLAFTEAVNGGAILTVEAGGGADNTSLYGGTLVLSRGGTAAATTISSGGFEAVDAGGQTAMDFVSSGGRQAVTSTGIAKGVTVYAGGSQTVASGGSALASVLNGGLLVVSAGGSAVNTEILPNGSLDLQAGAIATGALVFAGADGVAEIDDHVLPAVTISGFAAGDTIDLAGVGYGGNSVGSMGSNDVLSFTEGGSSYTLAFDATKTYAGDVFVLAADGAGTQILISGVVHSGPVVGDGQQLKVTSGQISSYVTIDSGGYAFASTGGLISASLVNNGGSLLVELGAIDGITVASGGYASVDNFSGYTGTASNVTVEAHGYFGGYGTFISTIVDGGTFQPAGVSALSTTINSGGVDDLSVTGTFTTVDSGGSLVIDEGNAISTTLSGGGETVNLFGRVTDTTIDGGHLLLGTPDYPGAITASGAIAFGAGAGTLEINTGVVMSATISGFAAGDGIDVLNLAPGSVPSAQFVASGSELVISAGGTSYDLPMAGTYAGVHFQATSDSGSGTLVQIACFAAGTRIATDRGAVPIEALAPGDHVQTQAGRRAPVLWLGRRDVLCSRHRRPDRVWPVRIAAAAFAPGVPARNLWLSPDHAVFVDGVLIPVRYLIDGFAIAQVAVVRVSYFHLELDRHDVVLAEGLPCESFLDTGNRGAFEAAGVPMHLHADFSRRAWDGVACAPLVVAGPLLDRVRARLLAAVPLPARSA